MAGMIECGYPNDPNGSLNLSIHDITVWGCPNTYTTVVGMENVTNDGRGSGKIHNVSMVDNNADYGFDLQGDWHVTGNRITQGSTSGAGIRTNIAAGTASSLIDANIFYDCDVGMELDNKSGGVMAIGANAFDNVTTPFDALDFAGDYITAHTVHWFFEGTLTTGLHAERWWPAGDAALLYSQISVVTSPTGAALNVEMEINGSTGHSQPMQIADGAGAPAQDLDNINNINGNTMQLVTGNNDYVEMRVTQIGSSVAGADLSVTLSYYPLNLT